MSSENNAPPTITPRLTVPRPDTDTTSRAGGSTASKHSESNGASNGSASRMRVSASSFCTPLTYQ